MARLRPLRKSLGGRRVRRESALPYLPTMSRMLFARLSPASAAFAVFTLGCTGRPVSPPAASFVAPPSLLGPGARDESPDWTRHTIRGCGTGFSGPTLNPGDAIRNAQAAALGEFAEAQGVRIQSLDFDDGASVHSVATFVSEAVLANVRVLAVETQRTGRSDDATARVTHAIACRIGSEPSLPRGSSPRWVIDPRSAAGQNELCAVGLSGPTFDKDDAPAFASRDAARALASVRRVLVSHAAADIDMTSYVVLRSDASVPDDAVDAMVAQSQERERWLDDDGLGPLALPKTTFVLRCTAR